jgi:RNA polymerase sigma-70 factor (ECF subfamily)
MFTADTFADLIVQARAGNRIAVERLLLGHYSSLAGYVRRRVGEPYSDSLTPEDLLQETLVYAVRDMSRCRTGSAESFASWLHSIVDHRLEDARRAMRTKKRGGGRWAVARAERGLESSVQDLIAALADRQLTPFGAAVREEALSALDVGIANLPDDQRQAVRLHFLEHRSVDETSAVMDRTPAAVRGLIHRAKQALRAALHRSSMWLIRR